MEMMWAADRLHCGYESVGRYYGREYRDRGLRFPNGRAKGVCFDYVAMARCYSGQETWW